MQAYFPLIYTKNTCRVSVDFSVIDQLSIFFACFCCWDQIFYSCILLKAKKKEMDHDHGGTDNSTQTFCMGSGMVMLNGFQTSFDARCILYLFPGAAVTSETKYAFAIVGTFLLAMLIELMALFRKRVAGYAPLKARVWLRAAMISLMYGVNMLAAYWIMLLVMTYEALIFTSIILGLTAGHFVTLILTVTTKYESIGDGLETGDGISADVSTDTTGTTPCCAGEH